MSRDKIVLLLWLNFFGISFGRTDEIFLRHSTTRYDLIEVSMAIWSGFLPRLMECSSKCSQEPNCLSLVYDKFYASCHLFNVIYESDDNGDINYWVLETRSTRWGPKSCTDISKCSGITRDGEFWIYPPAANGKRTKIYCHNMSTEPSHFVTLKNNNSFIIHDETNFLFAYVLNNKCKSSFNPPLKMVEFSKVKVQIEV